MIITRDLQIEMIGNKTIWKAYEISYNSFSDLKAWFQTLPGRIDRITWSGLNKTENKQLCDPTLNDCNS